MVLVDLSQEEVSLELRPDPLPRSPASTFAPAGLPRLVDQPALNPIHDEPRRDVLEAALVSPLDEVIDRVLGHATILQESDIVFNRYGAQPEVTYLRPSGGNVTKTNTKVLVATRLTAAERSALSELAASNDRPMSREVRRAILRYLRQEQDSQPAAGTDATHIRERP